MHSQFIQALERRVLFAVAVANGVMTITGTNGNDTIGSK